MAAVRRYKLTQDIIDSFYTESGFFPFRVGFIKDGTIMEPRNCAKITIADTDVVQTTNEWAQTYLLAFRIPQGIRHNGVCPPAGPVFIDVTGTIPTADVDLDPYFV